MAWKNFLRNHLAGTIAVDFLRDNAPTDGEIIVGGIATGAANLDRLLKMQREQDAKDKAREKRLDEEAAAAAKAALATAERKTARERAEKEARRRDFIASLEHVFASAPSTDPPVLLHGPPGNPKNPFCHGPDGALLKAISAGQWEVQCCYDRGGAGTTGAGRRADKFQVDQNVVAEISYATMPQQNEGCPMFQFITPIFVIAHNASTTTALHLDFKWSALYTPGAPSSQTDFLGEQSAHCDIPPDSTTNCGPTVDRALKTCGCPRLPSPRARKRAK